MYSESEVENSHKQQLSELFYNASIHILLSLVCKDWIKPCICVRFYDVYCIHVYNNLYTYKQGVCLASTNCTLVTIFGVFADKVYQNQTADQELSDQGILYMTTQRR